MIKKHYHKTQNWIERKRFVLLIISTLLVFILPAFSGDGMLSDILFISTLSFLFMQGIVIADLSKKWKNPIRIIVFLMITILVLKPAGFDFSFAQYFQFSFFILFFTALIAFLVKFIIKSKTINFNVILASVNVYLLGGVIGASLAVIIDKVYPHSFNFPDYMQPVRFVHYLYYSFITMTTVGYGDISPRTAESQTLAYLLAIAGQLYVAIIIAFLMGKLLMQGDKK